MAIIERAGDAEDDEEKRNAQSIGVGRLRSYRCLAAAVAVAPHSRCADADVRCRIPSSIFYEVAFCVARVSRTPAGYCPTLCVSLSVMAPAAAARSAHYLVSDTLHSCRARFSRLVSQSLFRVSTAAERLVGRVMTPHSGSHRDSPRQQWLISRLDTVAVMWLRRSPREIQRVDRRHRRRVNRFSPLIPLAVALPAAAGWTLWVWLGWRSRHFWGDPVGFTEAASQFPVLFLICFLVMYTFRILSGRLDETYRPSSICPTCQSVSNVSPGERCPCGGEFEPLRHWRWMRMLIGVLIGVGLCTLPYNFLDC